MAKERANFLDFLSPLQEKEVSPRCRSERPLEQFSPPPRRRPDEVGLPPRPPPGHFPQQTGPPAPFQANFFPVRLEPAGRRGVASPERPPSGLQPGGKRSLRKRQLSGFRSNFHPHPGGTEAASEGARGRGRALREPAGEPGQGRGCGGRGQEGSGAVGGVGGPRALPSSAIFQTFDPFRKARCSPAAAAAATRPHRPERQRTGPPGAGAPAHLPRSGRQRSPPGPLTAARAPPGPRRTPLAPLSRRLGPRPAGRPRTHSANLSRCQRVPVASVAPRAALPPGRCSRRHGGPALPPLRLLSTPDSGRGLAVSP